MARNREIEELEIQVNQLKDELKKLRERKDDIETAIALNADEVEENKEKLQGLLIRKNTAQMNVERAIQQRNESESVFEGLRKESEGIKRQVEEIKQNKQQTLEELEFSKNREKEIEEESKKYQAIVEEQTKEEARASEILSGIQLEVASITKTIEFAQENIDRVEAELEKFDAERESLVENAAHAKEDALQKKRDIEEIQKTIDASSTTNSELDEELKRSKEIREKMSEDYKGFFKKQEEISQRRNDLDKEIFRLSNQREKLAESEELQTNYMWTEYELTPHTALELQKDIYKDADALKKLIREVKDEIRKLGDVNVNAIEEYKDVSKRYGDLKTQHDDIVEAEATLVGIIEELDEGMRRQFSEKFAEIQREFDSSFKQLFGGGKGTLELVEEEDILECGIRIIAQPPGKKLQNMMQLSGGEKALTAIALLFAIQS